MPEWMTGLWEQTWVQITAIAGGVAVLAGLISNVDKIHAWCKGKSAARRERQEMPRKTYEIIKQMQADYAKLSGTVTSQGEKLDRVSDAVETLREQNAEQSRSIEEMRESIASVDKDTGNLLCGQLTREHDSYMAQGYCPSADKKRIADVYAAYKARGRNHLADHFVDDILNLPEKL